MSNENEYPPPFPESDTPLSEEEQQEPELEAEDETGAEQEVRDIKPAPVQNQVNDQIAKERGGAEDAL